MTTTRPQPRRAADTGRTSGPLRAGKRVDFSIVAIGVSAGGLAACKKLVDALPSNNGMAFLIVQHLEPSHERLLVDLLSTRTSMRVVQAVDGMEIERERIYIIPPGSYLCVDSKGVLRLSSPPERHAAWLPFDFLLNSLAETFGRRVVCVIMSGTGADGSLGLTSVKAKGGLVVVQDASEADYDGMPRNAIATGNVDHILSAAKIVGVLVEREQGFSLAEAQPTASRKQSRLVG